MMKIQFPLVCRAQKRNFRSFMGKSGGLGLRRAEEKGRQAKTSFKYTVECTSHRFLCFSLGSPRLLSARCPLWHEGRPKDQRPHLPKAPSQPAHKVATFVFFFFFFSFFHIFVSLQHIVPIHGYGWLPY